MTGLLTFITKTDVMWLRVFFFGGLFFAGVSQIIAYRNGARTWQRLAGLAFGIAAVLLLGAAGQIGNMKLTDYANSISARGGL